METEKEINIKWFDNIIIKPAEDEKLTCVGKLWNLSVYGAVFSFFVGIGGSILRFILGILWNIMKWDMATTIPNIKCDGVLFISCIVLISLTVARIVESYLVKNGYCDSYSGNKKTINKFLEFTEKK